MTNCLPARLLPPTAHPGSMIPSDMHWVRYIISCHLSHRSNFCGYWHIGYGSDSLMGAIGNLGVASYLAPAVAAPGLDQSTGKASQSSAVAGLQEQVRLYGMPFRIQDIVVDIVFVYLI